MPTRPYSASGKYDMAALLRCAIKECETLTMNTPAAAAALPQSAASAVQEYTSGDLYQEAYVCSGTIEKLGDTYGVLYQDTRVSTAATYITRAPRMRFQIVAADAASITPGVDVYIVDGTKRITHDSSGNKWIGKCLEAVETNPVGLPDGKYAIINFTQVQL